MKILLDECIDWRLARDIPGHEVRTVPQAGWASLKNGELLERAQADFDAFVTTDRNIEHAQNIPTYSIAVVVLRAKSNRVADLRLLIPDLLSKIGFCQRGTVTYVGGP